MKTFAILLVVFALPVLASAQKLKPMDDEVAPSETSTETVIYRNDDPQIHQSTGKVFSQEKLMRMPNRNVNAIAGTVAGVDSRAGTNETPSIRGADPSGTAYFVDGVRVYGSIPFLEK
jgi:outer membrane receptor for ferrienterochelin and colicin